MLKKINLKKLAELIKDLMGRGGLYAPVREDHAINFRQVNDTGDVTLDFYNTVESPKHIFFPHSDNMVCYKFKREKIESEEVPIDPELKIIFGVRPCDIKSFEIMDKLFTGGGIIDPYWETRRKNTIIIGYAFDTIDPVDFYNTFEIHAADPTGSDIFMVRRDSDIILKAITKKGEELLSSIDSFENASEEDENYFNTTTHMSSVLKTRTLDTQGIPEKLEEIFESSYWERAASPCLNCGICTFVCPTCHCFDIQDETRFGKGIRKKIWDSCMFTEFTLHASGHNPRIKKHQRLRQRVIHKFSYYMKKFDVISCVGCGRCTRYCPVNIDIFTVVRKAMEAEP